ncbi:MAG TPA: T9SS type A sorting domain-containing protein [Candidatus Kapabacteria bacterium]|nr:T9SS type A sorting domain-containing protein [Candidatus Kapabacteria bacterium]
MKRKIIYLIVALLIFSTAYSQEEFSWQKQLKIKNNFGSEFNLLKYGIDDNATEGVDLELGEDYDLPGHPPGEDLHAYFYIYDSTNTETTKSYIDMRPLKDSAHFYVRYFFDVKQIQFQIRTFEWGELGDIVDSAYFKDAITGGLVIVDMKANTSCVVDNEYINRFNLHIWFKNPHYVSVDENKETQKQIVYPNPFYDFITVNNNSNYNNIMVYNELGEELISNSLSIGENKLYFGNLPKGLYFVKLETAKRNKMEFFKIMKN